MEREVRSTERRGPMLKWGARVAAVFLAVVAVTSSTGGVANAASQGATLWKYCSGGSPCLPYQLTAGNSLDLGTTQLIMQTDGNLVMYYTGYGCAPWGCSYTTWVCWASNTNGEGGGSSYAILQSDGNFVVYPYQGGPALWASSWSGQYGSTVTLTYQSYPNVVVFRVGSNAGRGCTFLQPA
jgi:hypothetical protein